MAAFLAPNHPAKRAVILPLRLELSRFRGDDGRAWSECGPLDDQPLGAEVCARTGQTDSTIPEADKRLVES